MKIEMGFVLGSRGRIFITVREQEQGSTYYWPWWCCPSPEKCLPAKCSSQSLVRLFHYGRILLLCHLLRLSHPNRLVLVHQGAFM